MKNLDPGRKDFNRWHISDQGTMLYNYQESISKPTAYTQSFHIGHQAMYMEVGKVKQGSSNGRIILTVKLITPPYWLVKYIICVG